MAVALPISSSSVVLLIAVPGVWLAGRAAARRVFSDASVARVAAPGFGFVLWLLATHLFALAAGSFLLGLWEGSWTIGLLGTVLFLLERRSPDRGQRSSSDLRLRFMLVTACLATAFIARAAFGYWFHDEVFITGHMAMASEIQNDIYPPRHLSFPDTVLHYHYAFNLLTASVGAILRLPIDNAIDVVTVVSWGYTWSLIWCAGEKIIGGGAGFLASFVTLFGSRLPIPCGGGSVWTWVYGFCEIETIDIASPFISTFFQHPWSLGYPIALLSILLLYDRSARPDLARYAAFSLLLVGLAFSETVAFICVAPTLLVAEVVSSRPIEPRRILGALAIVPLVILGAIAAGGALFLNPNARALSIAFHPLATDTVLGTLWWHVLSFGLLLPLGVAGLFLLGRSGVFWGLLVAGSGSVLNLFRYQHSGDIIKFASLLIFALAFGASVSLWHLWRLRGRRRWGPVLAIVGALFATPMGVAFAFFFDLDIPRQAFQMDHPSEPSPFDAEAIAWLRARISAGESVYRDRTHAAAYPQWGGLPVPWTDKVTSVWGFSASRMAERDRFLASLPRSDIDAYLGQNIRWLVIDSTTETEPHRNAESWIAASKAARRATFGPLEVIELSPD